MKKRHFLQSLNDAADGIIYVVKHERNMRVHYFFGFFVLLCGIALGIRRVEWVILCTVTSLVWVAEMINTAVEETIDLLGKEKQPGARTVKHIAAGAVLVSALNAMIVGFFIFSNYWSAPIEITAFHFRKSSTYVTFVSLLVVVFCVIGAKAFYKKGTPFRGGPVSGHSAVAFAVWAALLYTEQNIFVLAVTFFLAFLVAQSRLRAKIHSFWEVIAGSLVGFLVTSLFFQIFQ